MSEATQEIQIVSITEKEQRKSENITLEPEMEGQDICMGADPFVFKRDGKWHLLLQEDGNPDPFHHDGIKGYTLRRADSIADLSSAPVKSLQTLPSEAIRTQSWAGEIIGDTMYVAHSNGDNKTHRMFAYETEGDALGPWKELGEVKGPAEDDSWAIDLTIAEIPVQGSNREYAVWSGWENHDDEFPQNIYIAEKISPTQLGKRSLLAAPEGEWSSSVKPLLEGPQALVLDGEFKGMLITGNASWTEKYDTRLLKYMGGEPLDTNSWKMASESLFPPNKGIGHGVIVQEGEDTYYVGHRKTSKAHGWDDRAVFSTKLDREKLNQYIDAIT